VYSDDSAYAFLDIAPWHRGHTLVVPKRHVVDLVAGEPVLAELAPAVDTVARLLVDRLGSDALNLFAAAGEVAGQEVFHLHLHLVPRYADLPGGRALFNPHSVSDAELDEVQARLVGSGIP
jgi:histidine triad (HIT) family protein